MRDYQIIAHAQGIGQARIDHKGQHAPVDQVGAIALGGVLHSQVGPAAQHLLAGGRLLARRAVARFDREDGGAQADMFQGLLPGEKVFHAGLAVAGGADFTHAGQQFRIRGIVQAGLFQGLKGLGPVHIGGVFAGQGVLRQFERIGAQGRGFARRNQLVRGGYGVGDHTGHLKQQMPGQGAHFRPVRDIGAEDQRGFRPGRAKAVVHAALVDQGLEVIAEVHIQFRRLPVQIRGRGQTSAARGRGRDGAGVHERHGGKLAA